MTHDQRPLDENANSHVSIQTLPANFWRHFAASVSSNLGDGMVAAAAPLLALSLTNDTRLIAAVSAAAMLRGWCCRCRQVCSSTATNGGTF